MASHQPVIGLGLSAMLDEHPDRVREIKVRRGSTRLDGVDVVLYDVMGMRVQKGRDLRQWLDDTDARCLVFSRDLRPDLRGRALAAGAHGWISMSATPDQLAAAIEKVMVEGTYADETDALGKVADLTPREVDILTLLAQGMSNQEVAGQLYLTLNTVKTYVRTAYRKIGVQNRAQAVTWCLLNGFPPKGL